MRLILEGKAISEGEGTYRYQDFCFFRTTALESIRRKAHHLFALFEPDFGHLIVKVPE